MYELSGIYVDGAWRSSTGNEATTVINPTTEAPLGSASVGNARDVDAAVRSARRALESGPWSDTTLEDRCAIVERLGKLIAQRRTDLAEIQTASMGTPYERALDLGSSIDLIDMYIESVRAIDLEYLRIDRFGASLIERRPVGVVAGIVPWNAPVRSEVKKTVPALLSGCTVVLKPAPETPFGAGTFVELCSEAGVPEGVVNLVPGGRETGMALVRHPDVRKIAFTGSTAAGEQIFAAAASSFKRLQLELGGKSAAIVLDDVDLGGAMPFLVAGNWGNSGQACAAFTRVLAPRRRYDEVVDAFVAAAAGQKLGDPMDSATTLGPLVAERQRDRVLGLIESGLAEGAELVAGGAPPSHLDRGWFVEPTVFRNVTNQMRIAREEVFGPVTTVIPYDTIEEAVAIANDSPYGLHGGVFGADLQRALTVARRIDTGTLAINGYYLPSSAPFGGIKASGLGREHGPEGYDSFLEYVSYNIPPGLAEQLAHLPRR